MSIFFSRSLFCLAPSNPGIVVGWASVGPLIVMLCVLPPVAQLAATSSWQQAAMSTRSATTTMWAWQWPNVKKCTGHGWNSLPTNAGPWRWPNITEGKGKGWISLPTTTTRQPTKPPIWTKQVTSNRVALYDFEHDELDVPFSIGSPAKLHVANDADPPDVSPALMSAAFGEVVNNFAAWRDPERNMWLVPILVGRLAKLRGAHDANPAAVDSLPMPLASGEVTDNLAAWYDPVHNQWLISFSSGHPAELSGARNAYPATCERSSHIRRLWPSN